MTTDHGIAADDAPPRSSAVEALVDAPNARIALLVVGVVAVSSAAVLARIAVAPALALAWWRTAAGALALTPMALRSGIVPDRRQQLLLAASGLLLAVHFWWWFLSLDHTTVAASAVLVSMSPVAVGAGAAWLLGEPPGRRTWVGLVLTVAGAVIIVADDVGGATARALLGDALAFAAALAMAGYLLLGRYARRTLPVSVYATWTYGSAALALLAVAVVTGTQLGITEPFDRATWLAIAALIVGPQLLGHTVFNLVLGRVSATVVAVVIIAEPVGATVLAAAVLGEAPDGWFYLGAPLVLLGVLLAVGPGRRGSG
ncbi:MAG TPA: DMT family transporter [Euzebyales bacterium]|nr:DMT family transporter [Euzebyales bacterium]